MKGSLEQGIHRFIRILFSIMVVLVFAVIVFVDKSIPASPNCTLDTLLPNIVLVLLPMLLLGGVFFLGQKWGVWYKLSAFCNRHFGWLLPVLAIVIFGVQCLYSYFIYFYPGWDASIVIGYAEYLAKGTDVIADHIYYSQYPNNIPITFVLAVLQRLAIWLDFDNQIYQICIAVGIAMVNLAGVFIALSGRRLMKSGGAGLLAYLLFEIIAGFSPWITIPYTDVYSILFPAMTFYFYVRACEVKHSSKQVAVVQSGEEVTQKENKVAWIWWLGIGLSGGFGYLIKPNSSMVLIAIVLLEVIKLFRQPKQSLRHFVALAVSFAIMLGLRSYMMDYTGSQLVERLKIGVPHYLMMGLNEETAGAYSMDDFSYSSAAYTREKRTMRNMQMVRERLQDYGVPGYMKFFVRKLLTNYNDGTFTWWMEGGFVLRESSHRIRPITELLRSFVWGDGSNYLYYATAAQGLWLMVQGLMLGMLSFGKKQEALPLVAMRLSLLGIFAFVMLFEARGRYLYCMLPMFVLCAVMGLRGIVKTYIAKTCRK